jgi:hypothetical protein
VNRKSLVIVFVIGLVIILGGITVVGAQGPADPVLLVGGLNGSTGMGSTVGPGQALYVTEAAAGRITRVDPQTGSTTTFASGLPQGNPAIGIGGVMDIAFIDETAYALVTLVGPDVGGSNVVGIYRVDGPNSNTVIANIGQFSIDNPPSSDFFVPTGVQYAMEAYRDGFVVTDGHHNRVLWVTLDGTVSELVAFDNIVPTGLDSHGGTIFMAEAGAVPHPPEEGKIQSFEFKSPYASATQVASGARLMVDVEFNRGRTLYGLSQGIWNGVGAGSPADANTGKLVRVNADGTVTPVAEGLDRPTSLEFINNTAYYVTLGGEVWMIEDVGGPSFGQ